MFEYILLSSTLLFLVAGAYYDSKHKELPYFLTLTFISFAFLIQVIRLILGQNVLGAFISTLIFGGLNYLLYLAGVRGGGDTLAIIGMSMALGERFIEFFLLYITIEFVAAFYSMFYILYLAYTKNYISGLHFTTILIPTIIGVYFNPLIGVLAFMLSSVLLLSFILAKYEKKLFVREVKVKDLVGEEWITDNVVVNGRVLVKKRGIGLTKQDILKLKKHKIKSIKIKEGIPLVPGYLAGLLVWLALNILFREEVAYVINIVRGILPI